MRERGLARELGGGLHRGLSVFLRFVEVAPHLLGVVLAKEGMWGTSEA